MSIHIKVKKTIPKNDIYAILASMLELAVRFEVESLGEGFARRASFVMQKNRNFVSFAASQETEPCTLSEIINMFLIIIVY